MKSPVNPNLPETLKIEVIVALVTTWGAFGLTLLIAVTCFPKTGPGSLLKGLDVGRQDNWPCVLAPTDATIWEPSVGANTWFSMIRVPIIQTNGFLSGDHLCEEARLANFHEGRRLNLCYREKPSLETVRW